MLGFVTLLKNPIGSLAYLLLILALTALWCNRKIWIWASFFLLSCACAYYSQIISFRAIASFGVLLLSILALTQEVPSFIRMLIGVFTTSLALAFFSHLVPGFKNILFVHGWQASSHSLPMNIYLNFDKGVAALFLLAFLVPLAQTACEWRKVLVAALPWSIFSCIVMIGIAYPLNVVDYDPKLPAISLIWLLIQIFFVAIPEEALYRGFIQKEITIGLNNSAAGILAVLLSSLLYGFMHLLVIPSLPYFIMAFISGVLYGAIYQITNRIEAAIITHLAVNIVHFFFFSYPMLISQ